MWWEATYIHGERGGLSFAHDPPNAGAAGTGASITVVNLSNSVQLYFQRSALWQYVTVSTNAVLVATEDYCVFNLRFCLMLIRPLSELLTHLSHHESTPMSDEKWRSSDPRVIDCS